MGDTILHYAAYKGNKELINYLLTHGASTELKNSVNYYLLHFYLLIKKRGLCPRDVAEDEIIRNMLSNNP